jgi:hypothetical protein
MTDEDSNSRKVTAVPGQDEIELEVTDNDVVITQVDSSCGREDAICVTGVHNLDALITAMQAARLNLRGSTGNNPRGAA